MKMIGGPFDGRDFPEAAGFRFEIGCREFYADPPGVEPYIAKTIAVYGLARDGTYEFVREEVVNDGYVAPVTL